VRRAIPTGLKSALRSPRVAVCLLIPTAAGSVCGCAASGSGAALGTRGEDPRQPTLSRCVRRWNTAPLGYGRLWAKVPATYSRQALMVTLPGDACALAFPTHAAKQSDWEGAYVTALSGDYALSESPLGVTPPGLTKELEARADAETNVRVEVDGAVTAAGQAKIPSLAVTFYGGDECSTVAPARGSLVASQQYQVTKTTVPCPTVRTLLWAWDAGEAVAPHADGPRTTVRILGWTCVGSDPTRRITRETPLVYLRVKCVERAGLVEAMVPSTAGSGE